MSITFYSPEAPRVVTDTYKCLCVSYSEDDEPKPNCTDCGGSGMVEFFGTENEINVSNANGREILEAIGLPPYECGRLDPDEIAPVLRTIVRKLNEGIDDPGYEPKEEGGRSLVRTDEDGSKSITGGARMIRAGRRAGYLTKRLRQLQTLLKEAADKGWPVVWA